MSPFIYILGVPNFANYEASASLIRIPREGGRIDYVCIGEDRLTRVKHTYAFPLRGVHYCLRAFGLESLDQVDFIYTDYARLPRWLNSGPGYRKLEHDYLKLTLRYPEDRIRIVDHHDAHAAGAFFPSGFDEAAVLVVDALGSRLNTQSLYSGSGSRIDVVERGNHWGIGRLYSLVTGAVLPYGPEKGYGKTMGLAPYGAGQPGPVLDFRASDSGMTSDYSAFFSRAPISRIVAADVRKCEDRERVLDPYFSRAAYDVQVECERQMVRMARYAFERTGHRHLCVAGGVALNGRANARILDETPFEQVSILPGCSDTGISLGLALWGYFHDVARADGPRARVSMTTAYTGRRYAADEIESVLTRYAIDSRPVEPEEVAGMIAAGKVVGWFEGGSEFGPRALGHRSIVADPRNPAMKDILNARVKFREAYRPYAASVLEEHAADWLNLNASSPFMLLVVEVREGKRTLVPAVTHVDHTTRPQTVSAAHSPRYYRLIRAFHDLTAVPMVLNTSLNVNREPIVETPLDLLICAFGTAIDVVYLEGRLIDARRYARPELVKTLTADRERALADEWREITKVYLTRYDTAERDAYLTEENKIAPWHRDYRSKYELEQKLLEWTSAHTRVLIIGTTAHTGCLYTFIPSFSALDVRGFVALDDLPGERMDAFALYPAVTLPFVDWSQIDAVLVSTHEYQELAAARAREAAPTRIEVFTMYDDAGDSLLFVLPGTWPALGAGSAGPGNNDHRTQQPGFDRREARIGAARIGGPHIGVDFDIQPAPNRMAERYAVIVNYHYCHPASEFPAGVKGILPEDLVRQLQLLTQNFHLTTLSELLDPDANLPETVALVTFDDGLKDVVRYALPILKRWGVPATVFCCSATMTGSRVLDVHRIHLLQAHLGVETFREKFEHLLAPYGSPALDSPEKLGLEDLYRYDDEPTRRFKTLLNYQLPYAILEPILAELFAETFGAEASVASRLYMSRDDLVECLSAGLEVGAHTDRHYILSRLSEEAQTRELRAAAEFLTHSLGVSRLHLAYPAGGSGTWNAATAGVLSKLGYQSAVTMARRIVKPMDLAGRWEIPRFDVRDVFDSDNNLRGDKLRALFTSE